MKTIVIGSSAEQKIPSLVLEWTIRTNSSLSDELAIRHTYDQVFPTPKSPEHRSRTGFSFIRFAIPEMLGYKGIGAYLECDQMVFSDVRKLFEIPFEGKTVLRTANQASVLLIDCARVTWKLDDILRDLDAKKFGYKDLMERLCVEPPEKVGATIPLTWNSLETYKQGSTHLLHFTNMAEQPWRVWWGHPLKHLWIGALRKAVVSGFISRKVLEEEVDRKHVVKHLLEAVR